MLRGAPQFLHFISETMSDNASFLDCSRIELMKAELSSLTLGKGRIGWTRCSQAHNGFYNNSSLRHIPRPSVRHIRFLSRPCHRTSAWSSWRVLHNTASVLDRSFNRPSY